MNNPAHAKWFRTANILMARRLRCCDLIRSGSRCFSGLTRQSSSGLGAKVSARLREWTTCSLLMAARRVRGLGRSCLCSGHYEEFDGGLQAILGQI